MASERPDPDTQSSAQQDIILHCDVQQDSNNNKTKTDNNNNNNVRPRRPSPPSAIADSSSLVFIGAE